MKITAIVPIKHHSSRVKGKNFKLMNGKELYRWILNTLLQVSLIDSIIIDTDSEVLFESIPELYKEEFKSGKIRLYRRPNTLCGDAVSTNDLFKNLIQDLDLRSDYYFQTHTTNPLLKPKTITDFIKTYLENKNTYTSAFSVKRHHTRFYTKDGKDMNHNRKILIPTQDLDPIFEENSCMYIFTKKSLFESDGRISDDAMLYEMDDIESQDIDWPVDFTITELLMKELYLNKKEL